MVNNNFPYEFRGAFTSNLLGSELQNKQQTQKRHIPFPQQEIPSSSDIPMIKRACVLRPTPNYPNFFTPDQLLRYTSSSKPKEQNETEISHLPSQNTQIPQSSTSNNHHSSSSNITLSNEASAILEASCLMMNDQTTADVAFLVDGQTFYAHKFLLSYHSKALKQFFSEKKNEPIIKIQKHSKEIFEQLLSFVYKKTIELNPDNFVEIACAQNYFQLNHLNKVLDEYLSKNLSIDNALSFLIKSQNKYPVLYRIVLSYILRTPSFFNTENLARLPKDIFLEIMQLNSLNLSEIEVLKVAIEWLNMQPKDSSLVSTVKKYIRFTCMDYEEIWSNVKHAQIHDVNLCSNEELIEISDKIARGEIESQRKSNNWLLPNSVELFEVKASKENEVIVSWKVPFDLDHPTPITSPSFHLNDIECTLEVASNESTIRIRLKLMNNTRSKLVMEVCILNSQASENKFLTNIFLDSIQNKIGASTIPISSIYDSNFIHNNHLSMQFKINALDIHTS